MKKSSVLIVFLALILLINLSLVFAELTPQEEEDGVNAAYNCLIDQINHKKCSSMSDAEKAFSLLAVDRCGEELINSAYGNMKYWPKNSPNIKTTAQATLALSNAGEDTDNSEDWIFEQTKTTKDLNWLLEIEATERASKCTIGYDTRTITITIAEDKTISMGSTDACLSPAANYGNYWLSVNKNCYEKTFTISCEDSYFLTTLLYTNENGNTIYVLKNTHYSEMGGTTEEKINSLCFGLVGGNGCDYEGTLWAATILDKLGYHEKLAPYMPYLIGNAETYSQFLPESFLYSLTGSYDYRTTLMERQLNGKYWMYNTDKFFGTAFALYPFTYDTFTEKIEAKEWLIEDVQGESGCWNNNDVLNTAFILHSIWPDYYTPNQPPTPEGCIDNGYYCVEQGECQGNLLSQYECSGDLVCCDDITGISECAQEGYECVEESECSGTIEDYECSGDLICCDNSNVNWCEENGFVCVVEDTCDGTLIGEYDCGAGFECCDEESIWPPEPECINAGFNCVQQGNCQGEVVPDLYCGPLLECCNDTGIEPPPVYDCEPIYTCMFEIDCEGEILENYECDNPLFACCDDYGIGPGPPYCGDGLCNGNEDCYNCEEDCGSCGSDLDDCLDNGFYCMTYSNCEGEILYDYTCSGINLCCSESTSEDSCYDLGGIVCDYGESCESGSEINTYDLGYGETCCIGGTCESGGSGGEIEYDCEINFGTCEPYSCDDGYEEALEYNCRYGDICCVSTGQGGTTTTTKKKSMWWLWLIFILIVLGLLGVLFRDKIKMFILKLKSGKGKRRGPPGPPRRGLPPGPPGIPPGMRRPMPGQRRILPPPQQMQRPSTSAPPSRPPVKPSPSPQKKSSGELNEVLKKLKDMSK